jgi:hypothetical protein
MYDLKKVLFTYGMSNDCMLIITDAPTKDLESFCYKYNEDLENNINNYFNDLKKQFYVKILVDSEVDDFTKDLVDIIDFDLVFDLADYIKEDL